MRFTGYKVHLIEKFSDGYEMTDYFYMRRLPKTNESLVAAVKKYLSTVGYTSGVKERQLRAAKRTNLSAVKPEKRTVFVQTDMEGTRRAVRGCFKFVPINWAD